MSHVVANGLSLLPELAVIEVAGEDRVSFVHGQLTNHIQNLGDAFRLAGYCTPQGRLQATMRVYSKDEKLFMVMAADLIEGFMKRFGMFILRSKVTLRKADELKVAGVVAPKSLTLPEVDHVALGELVVARVADVDGLARAYVIGSEEALNALAEDKAECANWWLGEVKAGLPWVFLATKEAFVPQWINMDRVGGVVFNKGCYPGQEIISRVQHIGSTPRRSVLLKAASVEVVAGDDVMIDGVANGKVVMAATVGNETWALAQVPLKALEGGVFAIKDMTFTVEPLPYAFA